MAQTLTNQHLPLADDVQELTLTLRPADSDAERYGLAIGNAARLFVDNQAHRRWCWNVFMTTRPVHLP
ncbi:hypothetical protein M8494_13515 [Serratia ureilytica]